MSSYLRVNPATGVAEAAEVVAEGQTPAECFEASVAACIILATGDAAIGWIWEGGKWVSPETVRSPVSDLIARAQSRQIMLSDGGISVNVAESGASPQLALASTDLTGRVDIAGLDALATKDTTFTTVWLQSTGSLMLNARQIDIIAVAVGKWRETTFTALSAVLADIENGALTTIRSVEESGHWPAVPTGQ